MQMGLILLSSLLSSCTHKRCAFLGMSRGRHGPRILSKLCGRSSILPMAVSIVSRCCRCSGRSRRVRCTSVVALKRWCLTTGVEVTFRHKRRKDVSTGRGNVGLTGGLPPCSMKCEVMTLAPVAYRRNEGPPVPSR